MDDKKGFLFIRLNGQDMDWWWNNESASYFFDEANWYRLDKIMKYFLGFWKKLLWLLKMHFFGDKNTYEQIFFRANAKFL